MREIVLDTETTGLDPFTGDRIVEIGCIELVNHVATGANFHVYVNPGRSMPEEAFAVHGISDEFLRDKPPFAEVGAGFLEFVGESPLVIHNAAFDMKFLNAELEWMQLAPLPLTRAVDTLDIARRLYPGAQNSLDALCRRFGIDNSARTLHGALLDAEILAEVYLELIGGRQPGFALSASRGRGTGVGIDWRPMPRPTPLPPRITEAERIAHAALVETLGEKSLW
ncbi:DNA polymerase III subunit epsilon [Pontibaca methylaminivorans]|uniref:DNA polymerase III subunit epsilon n=1 Tax=Pontibaca methylaminivorans TaxID=515897 RepID=A0A1R3WSG0_9RHOB|nr:DNA polymerase III subunit epsilon [Pontibaca methylaminivorans]SIT80910.1 DNA polymerase-3 subunit epsilon [Pontibaca methylaminivorans]